MNPEEEATTNWNGLHTVWFPFVQCNANDVFSVSLEQNCVLVTAITPDSLTNRMFVRVVAWGRNCRNVCKTATANSELFMHSCKFGIKSDTLSSVLLRRCCASLFRFERASYLQTFSSCLNTMPQLISSFTLNRLKIPQSSMRCLWRKSPDSIKKLLNSVSCWVGRNFIYLVKRCL